MTLVAGATIFNCLHRFAERDADMRQGFHHMIFDGSHRDIESLANFAIRHLVEPVHDEYRARPFRQLRQRALKA